MEVARRFNAGKGGRDSCPSDAIAGLGLDLKLMEAEPSFDLGDWEIRRFAGREKQPQSGALRHSKQAACILGLTVANMWLSLICGFT